MDLSELNVPTVLSLFKEAIDGISRHDYSELRVIADAFEEIGDNEFATKLREMQPQSIKEEYWHQVEKAANNIVTQLIDEENRSRWESTLAREVHEYQNTHEWVLDTDKAAEVLKHSNHPAAEIFHHQVRVNSHSDEFPFAQCAAGAFEMDLTEKVLELLLQVHGIDFYEEIRNIYNTTAEEDE